MYAIGSDLQVCTKQGFSGGNFNYALFCPPIILWHAKKKKKKNTFMADIKELYNNL